jgi:Zn-dependent peptidase ImmA (M78 family)
MTRRAWRSAAARRLLELSESKTIECAIEKLASEVSRGMLLPPTDLVVAARNLGVSDIRGENIPVDGVVRKEGAKLIVVYSRELAEGRRRFTIAHELGHVLFAKSGANFPRHGEELERLCDMFAAELLMPSKICRQMIQEGKSSTDFHKVFQTSLQAADRRYEEISGDM